MSHLLRFFLFSIVTAALSACGGGGSSDEPAAPELPDPVNDTPLVVTADQLTNFDPAAFPINTQLGDSDMALAADAPQPPVDETAAEGLVDDTTPDKTVSLNDDTGLEESVPLGDTLTSANNTDESAALDADTVVESTLLEDSASVEESVSLEQATTFVPREVLAPLNLPIEGSTIGDYRLVNAYPELSFQEALLVAAVPGEDRLLVVEQTGLIKVFEDDPDTSASDIILDISEEIAFSGEQGLLGLAFDPDFSSNRLVYLNYTTENPDQTIVSKLIWDPVTDVLDTASEEVVISIDQPFHSHNAGMIAFGPDNYLYIALGDGGDGGDPHNFAQDLGSLLGSLLRIDVHPANPSAGYAIPADNPFVGVPGAREEIFAYGFRNPFRFSFDRATGDIWLGDVGQEEREEINLVVAGGNYGWRVFEGTRANESSLNTLPDSAFTAPVHEYDHASGLSVIGGYVYRGNRVSSLTGRYIYADFYSGVVTALNWSGERVTSQVALASVDGPTSFGETHDGDVLVVSRYQGIFRFEEQGQSIAFPEKLSQTGLYEDIDSLSLVSGLTEYRTAHPFWSDGASKQRWIGVPEFKHITFSEDDWEFPIGSVSVKHFDMQMTDGDPVSRRRLETRVLYNTRQGWQGASYRWNQLQNEATIVRERLTESLFIRQFDGTIREQTYEYPGNRDCQICHNSASTFLLGLETRQMNIDHASDTGVQNQISSLNQMQLFDRDVSDAVLPAPLPSFDDESASDENRARAYLDVNCSHCHQPQGPAATQLDLRYETRTAAMGAVNVRPQNGSLGISNARIVAPGDRERSILWLRMKTLESERMPPVATHRIDFTGLELIGRWIDQL